MPELPEVETIRRGLQSTLLGLAIEAVSVSEKKLRKPSPDSLESLAGWKINSVIRTAKVLFFQFGKGDETRVMSAHLGMTGKFRFHPEGDDLAPHTHAIFHLSNGQELRFSDPRRFGWLSLEAPNQPSRDAAHYGPDCLTPEFTIDHFIAVVRNSGMPMKSILLDQSKMSGIGNIYACEALWRAHISPTRKGTNVAASRLPLLHRAIQDVLQEAVDAGGTSFNDYVDTLGQPGKFIANLAVFQRAGEPCPNCGSAIKRIPQGGRSSFYCESCQR